MKDVKSGAAHLEYAQWLLEVTNAFGVEEIRHKVGTSIDRFLVVVSALFYHYTLTVLSLHFSPPPLHLASYCLLFSLRC